MSAPQNLDKTATTSKSTVHPKGQGDNKQSEGAKDKQAGDQPKEDKLLGSASEAKGPEPSIFEGIPSEASTVATDNQSFSNASNIYDQAKSSGTSDHPDKFKVWSTSSLYD